MALTLSAESVGGSRGPEANLGTQSLFFGHQRTDIIPDQISDSKDASLCASHPGLPQTNLP